MDACMVVRVQHTPVWYYVTSELASLQLTLLVICLHSSYNHRCTMYAHPYVNIGYGTRGVALLSH